MPVLPVSVMSSTGDRESLAAPWTLEDCLSCKLLCGGGLLAAGGYVYAGARKNVRGGMASMGTMAQIMVALGLASFGITILARPQNSQPTKLKSDRLRETPGLLEANDPVKPRDV